MKKVSIIILLTALILGAFTACNGDVFSELMPKPKRTITLEIPEDCKTWEVYLKEVTDIAVYENGLTRVLNTNYDDKVYFGVHKYGLLLDDSKVPAPPTVEASAEIEIGGTYTLTRPSN